MNQEWQYMTSKQLQKSLDKCHRALFDNTILKNDCENANEKELLPEIESMIRTYQKLIQEYESGIITLRNREAFLA